MAIFSRRQNELGPAKAVLVSALLFLLSTMQSQASCNIPGLRVSIAASEWLLRRPTQLLERYPNGEAGLVSESLAFATSDLTLKPVVSISARANTQQRRAIGEGLGRAAFLCQRYDSATTRKIRELVENFGDMELKSSFRRAFQIGSSSLPGLAPTADAVRPPQLPGTRQGTGAIYGDDFRSGRALGLPNVRTGDSLAVPPVPGVSDPLAPIR